jgi:hypothetical protein
MATHSVFLCNKTIYPCAFLITGLHKKMGRTLSILSNFAIEMEVTLDASILTTSLNLSFLLRDRLVTYACLPPPPPFTAPNAAVCQFCQLVPNIYNSIVNVLANLAFLALT